MSHKNTPETFWARVSKAGPDDCWEWTGALTSNGYGNLGWGGTNVQAHRLAFALAVGGIGLLTGFRQPGRARVYRKFVLHRCDNRKCCNPAHLFLGSMRANQLDAYEKGRKVQPRSKHANAKMSPDTVREVRRLYAQGARQVDLAAMAGVSQVAISLVVRNETYKDIT
jgi:hypothetical protein